MTRENSGIESSTKKLLSWASMSGCMSPNPVLTGGSSRTEATACLVRLPGPTSLEEAAYARPARECVRPVLAAYSPDAVLAARSRALVREIMFFADMAGQTVRLWGVYLALLWCC